MHSMFNIILFWLPGLKMIQNKTLLLKSQMAYTQCVVLATGPNLRVSCGSSSTRNRTVATGLTTRKTRTIWNGPVSPPQTRHSKFTILAPIKYCSSDHTATWSIHRLCSFSRSCTSGIQIFNQTNIHWVAMENPRISLNICLNFTATQWISIVSPIWMLEMKELVKLHNLHIHHVTIQSELRYLIGAEVAGTLKWNRGPSSTWPKNHR